MKTMKFKQYFGRNLAVLLIGLTSQDLFAQSAPQLSLSKTSPTSIAVNWTNQIGTSYRVWFTTNLAEPFALLEDAFSPDEMVSVYSSTTETPLGFFRVQVPTNAITPDVQIFSPSNSVTVSGEIAVRMGAQLGTQVQGVNLYLDDALVGYLNSGGMNFSLDTSHFANGQHTVYVGAVDTANNETLSSTITLTFDNPVRWLDACSLFNYYVPINVESDIYPADWLVTVTDTNGTIVRTISGSTTDGIIQTSWDGTDDNSQPLPVENLYEITVDVVETSGSSMLMASSLASSSETTSAASTVNEYGVAEYSVQVMQPNPMDTYTAMLNIYEQLTPKEKLIYPLPRKPVDNPNATTTVKMSAREKFLADHQTSTGAFSLATGMDSPNAGAEPRKGQTKNLAWWENQWNSGKIEVARVPMPGTYGNTIANNCNQIAIFIGAAEDTVGNNRGVNGGYVQLISSSSDVANLKNDIANPNVTALYFYGHGTASGNAFGTSTSGIFASNLATLFGNYYRPSYKGKPALVTHKPFNFVFLDGCNTALGDLPEAFGIPKKLSGATINEAQFLHKRAFLGWTGPVTFVFDDAHAAWSLKFWTVWMDEGNADKTITEAIAAADSYQPSVPTGVPIRRYGNGSLKWSD